MAKWQFYDFVTDTTQILDLNPSEAEMGGVVKSVATRRACSPTGQNILFEGRRQPRKISFNGVTFTKAQYEVFKNWAEKDYQVKVTDDLGREFWVVFTRFAPTRRSTKYAAQAGAASVFSPWLTDYSMEATVLDWT